MGGNNSNSSADRHPVKPLSTSPGRNWRRYAFPVGTLIVLQLLQEVAVSRFLIVFAFLFTQSAFGLGDNIRRWIIYETMVNAAATRDPMPVQIEHFEIPLKALARHSSTYSDREANSSLVFLKNGVEHVRWIINPEDTVWHLELEKILAAEGLDTTRYKYFRAFRSASRTYFIEDPVTGYEFFAKVSTNNTGGQWRSKQQDWEDAKEVKMAADAIHRAHETYTPRYLKVLNEGLVFGHVKADQAMVIRSFAELRNTRNLYLPGFSALHEEEGRRIAKLNGSNDPERFWNEHFNKPLARAMAEYNLMTGLSYDSPHSQNFLVELDGNMRPTGKIVFRDFGDAYVSVDLRNAMTGKLQKLWTQNLLRTGTLSSTIGLLHGNKAPSWLPAKVYDRWGDEYRETYDREVSRLTEISLADLKKSVIRHERSGEYFYHQFNLRTPAWKGFIERVRQTLSFRAPERVRCAALFAP